MDLFLASCQGIGLALAAGAVAGGLDGAARRGEGSSPLGVVLLIAALVGGALLFGASLATEDHPAWPGWPVGALLALLAFYVSQEVIRGAAARSGEEGSAGTLLGFVIVAAAVLAALSLVISPVALVAFVAVVWLGVARRRRAARKHEGLRVLR